MNQDRKIRILYGIILVLALMIASFFVRRVLRRTTAQGVSYYEIKVNTFRGMPRKTGQILFLGDSITDWCDFSELLPFHVINRGIAGDTTAGVLNRLDEVISHRPSKLFLLIGTNDISQGVNADTIAGNIRQIITRIHDGTAGSKIYLQSLFPVRNNNSKNTIIQELNAKLKDIAGEMKCAYIDLYPLLLTDGELGQEYTVDGLHLTGTAYARWMDYLKPYLEE